MGASSSSSSQTDVNQLLLEAGPCAGGGRGTNGGLQVPLTPIAGAGCLLSALGHFCSWKLVKLTRRTDALRMPGGASAGLRVAPQRPQVLARDVSPTPAAHAQLLKGCDGGTPNTRGQGYWPRHTRRGARLSRFASPLRNHSPGKAPGACCSVSRPARSASHATTADAGGRLTDGGK